MLDNNEKELNELSSEMETSTSETTASDLLDDDLLSEGEGVVDLNSIRNKANEENRINNLLKNVSIFLLILFLLIFSIYYYFTLTLSNTRLEGYKKDYVSYINDYILSNLTDNIGNSNINNATKNYILKVNSIKNYIEDKSVFFYDKQENIKSFLSSTKNSLTTKLNNIKQEKTNLIKYRYLPKELTNIVKDIKLTPILLTLSSIKLYITDYVYIKMGTFDENILSYVKKNNSAYSRLNNKFAGKLSYIIKEDITLLRELGAKTYLNDIVFNYMYVDPNKYAKIDKFANNYFITDFYNNHKKLLDSRYNQLLKNDINIKKTEFLADYISILSDVYNRTNDIFNLMEENSLPVNINLLTYDPKKQILAFNVKLSVKEGESNVPVIRLATDVITLLRESRLIIGSNINFNKLNVNKVTIRGINGKKVYDTINLVFKTSVQKDVNVEVTDSNLNK